MGRFILGLPYNKKYSHFNREVGKISQSNPKKIQEKFCKGLDFGIRTQVCSYIRVQRLQKPVFVISISNLSIPFLISFNQI